VATTLPFGAFTMVHPKFVEGLYDTHFIESYFSQESYSKVTADLIKAAGHLAAAEYITMYNEPKEIKGSSNWRQRNLIQ